MKKWRIFTSSYSHAQSPSSCMVTWQLRPRPSLALCLVIPGCYAIFGDSNFILAEYIPENPSSRIYVHDSLKIVYRHAWWCDHFHRVWLSHHVAYKAGIWLRFCVYSMAHGPFNGVSYLNLKSEDAAVGKKAIYINIINAGDSDVKSRMITTHNVTQCNL